MPIQRGIAAASILAAAHSIGGEPTCTPARDGTCAQFGRDHVLLQAHRYNVALAGSAGEPHLYKERNLTADEGNEVGKHFKIENATACAALCDGTDGCRSFTYSRFQSACYLKDKDVQEDDPAHAPGKWHHHTYMRVGPHDSSAVVPADTSTGNTTARADGAAIPLRSKAEARVYVERSLVAQEGHEIFAKLEVNVDECKALCDSVRRCESFAFSAQQSSCHLKTKQVTKDDQAAETYLDFKTYMVIDDCARGIDGGNWTLVRHTKGSGNWGPWNDNLAGTAEHGEPSDGLAAQDWSVAWKSTPQQFLFAFADCSHWLIAEPSQVNGANYANEPRWIVKSSEKAEPYQARWYNRAGNGEDPWVSERHHWISGNYGSGAMLYGEAGNADHLTMKNAHGGANVYIRGTVPDCAAEIDGGSWTLVRHTRGSGNWGPWDDNLAGTAEHGEPTDGLAAHDWTVPWEVTPKQFLFAFADCSHWLIAEPSQVNGANYADELRWIEKSSEKAERYQAKWYNRAFNSEDPWVSERDHWLSGKYGSGAMLYGEAGKADHLTMKNDHGGANVYIRTSVP